MIPTGRVSFSEQFGISFFKFEPIFNLFYCFYCAGRPTDRPRPVSRPASYPRQPAHWPAQTGHQAGHGPEGTGLVVGPDRGQAGQASEPAGLKAGPGREHGRSSTRACSFRQPTATVPGGDLRWERDRGRGRGLKGCGAHPGTVWALDDGGSGRRRRNRPGKRR